MNPNRSDIYKAAVKKIVSQLYVVGGRGKEDKGVLFYQTNNPESFFNWATTNGYLLHGSSRKIYDQLEPYHANDKVKESGNRKAVYVTRVPVVAMFCALTGGIEGLERRHQSHTTIDRETFTYKDMYFGVNDNKLIAHKGYVYILDDCQVDEELNGEYLSYKPVDPVAIVEFLLSDFPYEIAEF